MKCGEFFHTTYTLFHVSHFLQDSSAVLTISDLRHYSQFWHMRCTLYSERHTDNIPSVSLSTLQKLQNIFNN